MFGCAIAWGHQPETAWNPYNGVVRYRHGPAGRLLGAGDSAKHGAVMRRHENECPVQLAALRLILLTGCRPRGYAASVGRPSRPTRSLNQAADRVAVAVRRKPTNRLAAPRPAGGVQATLTA